MKLCWIFWMGYEIRYHPMYVHPWPSHPRVLFNQTVPDSVPLWTSILLGRLSSGFLIVAHSAIRARVRSGWCWMRRSGVLSGFYSNSSQRCSVWFSEGSVPQGLFFFFIPALVNHIFLEHCYAGKGLNPLIPVEGNCNTLCLTMKTPFQNNEWTSNWWNKQKKNCICGVSTHTFMCKLLI